MELRAVFFDAGETLLYPYPSFPELFSSVLANGGQQVDPDRIQEVVSVYSERFAENARTTAPRLWSTSREASRAFWLDVYRLFLADLGTHNGPDETAELAERLYEAFSNPANYRLHDDAIPTLERISTTGLTLGLISNFEAWLADLLDTLGVGRYFEIQVISGIEGVEKPDPAIFTIAVERAGVPPAQAAYVGDHPIFDIEAARKAGLVAVLIDRRGRYEDASDLRVRSLEDVPAALGLDV
ncbi:MAG: HAD-IA family hydrolase [Actinomycetota bacterium]